MPPCFSPAAQEVDRLGFGAFTLTWQLLEDVGTRGTLTIYWGKTTSPAKLLLAFYGAAAEGILSHGVTVWYAGCSASDGKTLRRVVKAAPCPSLDDVASSRYHRRATQGLHAPCAPSG